MGKIETRIRGQIRLEVTEDATSASVILERNEDGQEISEDRVMALLKSRNIAATLSREKIAQKIKKVEKFTF